MDYLVPQSVSKLIELPEAEEPQRLQLTVDSFHDQRTNGFSVGVFVGWFQVGENEELKALHVTAVDEQGHLAAHAECFVTASESNGARFRGSLGAKTAYRFRVVASVFDKRVGRTLRYSTPLH